MKFLNIASGGEGERDKEGAGGGGVGRNGGGGSGICGRVCVCRLVKLLKRHMKVVFAAKYMSYMSETVL